ncbi:flavoprotein [Tribonema minus]|uniref:Flavoprotein n=1 Tax=Tribonema minus TaxID=303371 RepID=A0A835YV88_9STRA|nr:flavoprotein [Tribonema minus]
MPEDSEGERHLHRPRILLGATGSVATVKIPRLALLLQEFADVKIIVTKASRAFLDCARDYDRPSYDAWSALEPPMEVLADEGEWGMWSKVGDPVQHVQLREWADLLLIAPLSANTLGKLANGLCDNLLTCVARAWDVTKPLIVAPAMNTHMWSHPLTARHLASLGVLGVTTISPVVKTLACGDTGTGALADVADIAAAVRAALLSDAADGAG